MPDKVYNNALNEDNLLKLKNDCFEILEHLIDNDKSIFFWQYFYLF